VFAQKTCLIVQKTNDCLLQRLNILGDRMQNPSATISLVGSSENGPADGLAMAESVKTYLVTVFAIDGSRIATKGQNKPNIPSLQAGGTVGTS
jgi:hypothetical protein